MDDFREAYYWLRRNTHDQARVMSWWDYGYQIAGMGNKTTLVDNNTWNNSHIALVRQLCLLIIYSRILYSRHFLLSKNVNNNRFNWGGSVQLLWK